MSRAPFLALLAVGLVSASAARARVDVAPPPREIRPDGSRDPAPQPEPAKRENPLEVVDRIIKNSKAVGDKLAMTDTGTETRGTQDRILKDIQSLIDQQENPPPPKPDQNDKNDKNDKDKQDQKKPDDKNQDKKPNDMNDKKSDMMPTGGMDMKQDMPPMGGMGGMDQQPMGGDQPRERRPRQQGDQPKEKNAQPKDPMNAGGNKQQPMNATPPKDPKNTGGARPDPNGDPKNPPVPSLPFEDEVVKNVWGHLPDKLRQQATQYYQQEFLPRYAELLRHYYSSMSDRGPKK